jgi:hypothetical protein
MYGCKLINIHNKIQKSERLISNVMSNWSKSIEQKSRVAQSVWQDGPEWLCGPPSLVLN